MRTKAAFSPGADILACAGPSSARSWVHGLVKGTSAATLGAYIGCTPGSWCMVQGRYSSPETALHQGLRGLGFFGSGAACQFAPSMVLSTALAVAGVTSPSPSHVDQASSSRIAGMRGSSSWDLIVRRMSSLAGTVV